MRVPSTFSSHVSLSHISLLLLLSPCSLHAFPLSHCVMEEEEPFDSELEDLQQLHRVDDSDFTLSSILTSDDSRNFTSSGDISSASSGEIQDSAAATLSVILAPILPPAPATEEPVVVVAAAREKKCVGRSNKGLSWGQTSVIGRRKEMEDAVAVVPGFMSSACGHIGGCTAPGSRSSGEISPVHFFGVYDGHGGSQVAKFCAKRMHDVIAEEWGSREAAAAGGPEWRRNWEAVFANGFERVDSEIKSDEVAPEMVGSTATVVALSGCQIITSNCGDSRVVLCRRTQSIPLTVDQKPDRQDELLRIEGGGGRVINWNGARVFGVLAMSRAIGDRYLRPWIIPVPEITFTERTDEDECLVLASDGLWDVMTNEEVGEVARHILRRRRRLSLSTEEISPAQVVADSLTEIACGRNSKDNISIIVVDLKSKRRRQQRPP